MARRPSAKPAGQEWSQADRVDDACVLRSQALDTWEGPPRGSTPSSRTIEPAAQRRLVHQRGGAHGPRWLARLAGRQTVRLRLDPRRRQQERVRSLPSGGRAEEHTSELQSLRHLVCRLLLEKKKRKYKKPDREGSHKESNTNQNE